MAYTVFVGCVVAWIAFEAVVRGLLMAHAIGARHRVEVTECHTDHWGKSGSHEQCTGVWTDGAGHAHRVDVNGPAGSTHDVYVWLGRSSDQRAAALAFLLIAGLLAFVVVVVIWAKRTGKQEGDDVEAPVADDTGVSPPA